MSINRLAKGSIVTASLAPASTSFVQSPQTKENDTNPTGIASSVVYTIDNQPSKIQLLIENPVKDAIRAVLKNKAKLFKLIEKFAEKKIRTELEKRFSKYIEPVLRDLLDEYSAFGWSDVQNKLYKSLKKSGLSDSSAKAMPHWTTIAIKAIY
ncbi:hypothetical protein GBG21_16930 [Aeribacillus pallidus]